MLYAPNFCSVENHTTCGALSGFTSLALIGFSIYNARASQQTAKLQSSESVIDKSQQLLQTGALLNATEISEYLSEAIYRAEMLAANALFLKIIQKKLR